MSDPALTHRWDQFLASMVEMAAALGRYRDALIEAGFSREEAIDLVFEFHDTLLGRRREPPE